MHTHVCIYQRVPSLLRASSSRSYLNRAVPKGIIMMISIILITIMIIIMIILMNNIMYIYIYIYICVCSPGGLGTR